MSLTQPVSRVLTDEKLVRCLRWPLGLSAEEIRSRVARARRFIDFDDTLTVAPGITRKVFCGRPLGTFLAEEPFLLQTWGAEDAVPFFRRRPELPQPLVVLAPPSITVPVPDLWFDPCEIDPEFCGERWVWKDLAALGITSGTVFDDLPHNIWAPGCEIVSAF